MNESKLPEGFCVTRDGNTCFIADRSLAASLLDEELDCVTGWTGRLDAVSDGPSRGKTARLIVGDRVLRLKQLRRGGATARLWCHRFPGRGRLLRNLGVPSEARRRGVPTPRAVALLLVEGPPGLHRGWLAIEEVEGARDLVGRFNSDRPPSVPELAVVMAVVRGMHDAGIDHRDLNLGNLLLRTGRAGPEGFVIDLDGARLGPRAIPFGRRQRSLRRLERSYVKWVDAGRQDPSVRDAFYAQYAGADRDLARRLSRGRRLGRLGIGLRRFGR